MTESRLLKDLRKIGVKRNDHLAVGLSLGSIGRVEGGPDAVIDALLDAVGPEGTVMMNTHTRFVHASKIESINYIFDPKITPVQTGVVPEAFRKRPDAIRSRHPVTSVTAVGKMAEYLTQDHNQEAGAYSPYSRLAEIGGNLLYIGLGDRLVAVRHEAQKLAGLAEIVPLYLGIRYLNERGEVKTFIGNDFFSCLKRHPELVKDLRARGVVKEGFIGNAKSLLLPTRETLFVLADALKKDPTRNLCADLSCMWCRVLENRMNLCGRIENPRLYQRNPLVRNTISFLNGYRLQDSRTALRAVQLMETAYLCAIKIQKQLRS
jgi:aminoglycoside 3-N-acetyltransferase